ncbi:methionyl-tRNA formyltransferase [Fastidiosibacter lacustris]|uniref:methionyl-tRNA formyltransferase n=1 Tax=Fastidiosibacter lacustris TaxID=2056695 RepID=UPI000E355021|nr:methionyl-tRNA formyltransferase [Fastidiosibacter lacustris]
MNPQNKGKNLRIVFAGTPEISATVLNNLIGQNYNIVGVFTQPDRVKGRGKKLQASAVKELALTHNIPVFQPISFNKEPQAIDDLQNLQADVMVVIAYGLLLPRVVLDVPKYGCINIHVSLLPKWRGAAPIQRAIEAGDTKTGITIMQMDEGLDTGDILHVVETPILKEDDSQTLHDRLAKLSVPAIYEVFSQIASGTLHSQKQPEDATYARKLTKEEGLIDFNNTVQQIDCKVRAFSPWPSAYIKLDNEQVKISDIQVFKEKASSAIGTILSVDKSGLKVQACNGVINIGSLQFPGKKMLSIASILNGKDLGFLIGKKL